MICMNRTCNSHNPQNFARIRKGVAMLDFRIYTFLTVCATMNFTKAAEQLHITQPAVSQHIRYLEELYQTKLFVHEGKKIRLSPAGEILLHTATTLKNDENVLFEQMHQPELDAVPLHFGVTMTIGELDRKSVV